MTRKKVEDITIQEIRDSGLIITEGEIKAIGKSWFKDTANGMCYNLIKGPDGLLSVISTRQSKISNKPKVKTAATPKVPKVSTVVIQCVDCGTDRTIKVQDKFQVKRCIPCQKKYRNHKRYLKAQDKKAKLAALKKEGGEGTGTQVPA